MQVIEMLADEMLVNGVLEFIRRQSGSDMSANEMKQWQKGLAEGHSSSSLVTLLRKVAASHSTATLEMSFCMRGSSKA
jgi:hypothetical protein